MKNLVKQTIISGKDFTLQHNVNEIDIFEEKYVASIVNRKDGQMLRMNQAWYINLSLFKELQQINVFDQNQKTVLIRDKQGMFPEFQTDQLGAYTKTYAQQNLEVLAA